MARLSLPSKPAGYSFPSIVRPPLVQSDMPSIWFTLVGLRLSSPLRIDSGGTLIQRGQMPRAVMPRLQARGHLRYLASLPLRCKISCRLLSFLGFSHSTKTASWYSSQSAKRPEDLPEAKPNQEQAYSRILSRAESQSAAVYIATPEPPIVRHRLCSLIAKVSLDEKTIIHHARLQQHRAACGSPGCAGSIRPSQH